MSHLKRSAHLNKILLNTISCLLLSATIFGGGQVTAKPLETRCGWFSNPTPGNISLYDKDGEWLIGVQGGYQVKEDDWAWPDFKPEQWVITNAGDHGYGCACLQVVVNRQTHEVVSIQKPRAQALAICRQDKSIKKQEHFFK